MATKPTYEELEQRVKELQGEALQRQLAEVEAWEKTRRLEVAYDQAITYARELKDKIAEHQLAEEKIKRLSSTVEAMVDGVTITDLHGKITYVNRAVTKQLGYKKEELTGKTPAAFVSEKDLPKFSAQIQDVLSGRLLPESTEYLPKSKTGETYR